MLAVLEAITGDRSSMDTFSDIALANNFYINAIQKRCGKYDIVRHVIWPIRFREPPVLQWVRVRTGNNTRLVLVFRPPKNSNITIPDPGIKILLP
jgi:hypothetical protein